MKRKVIRVPGVYADLAGVFGTASQATELEKEVASFSRPDGKRLVSIWLDGDPNKFLCTQEENKYAESIAWKDRTQGYYFTPGYQGFFTAGPEIAGQKTISTRAGAAGALPRIPAAQLAADGNPLINERGTLLMRMAIMSGASTTGMALATDVASTSSGGGIGYINPNGGLSSSITGTPLSTSGADYRDDVVRTYGVSWAADRGVSLVLGDSFVQNRNGAFTAPSWTSIVLFGRGATDVASQVLQADVARVLLLTDDIYDPFYSSVRETIFEYMAS